MKFNTDQEAIIQDNSNYVQVVAGAGSGKTHTMIGIMNRILEEKKELPESVLVLTFSRKAALEFTERLNRIHPLHGIAIQTFHAYCFSIIRKYHPEFKLKPPSILTDSDKENFLKDFLREHKFTIGGIPFKYLINEVNGGLAIYFPDLYKISQEKLEEYKSKENKLEFKDLVKIFLNALESQEEWTILPKTKIRRVIVDEFQDTDEEQLRFLKLLDPERITVVGDDWQAIYGFRGATPKPFLEFGEHFAPLKRHFLATNYRSLPKIVEISRIPIQKNSDYIPKDVVSARKGKSDLGIWLFDEGIKGTNDATKKILKLIKKNPDTRILCRTNFRIHEFKTAGIPLANLLTIHASKGLEFDSVFVDLLGGWSQSPATISNESLQEERRILYVAISRSKNDLFLLGRSRRSPKKNLEDEFMEYFMNSKIPKSKNLLDRKSLS
ncbi:DEAD/DEAH box helicase [Leptospira sp. GIMC2001]|uniref:DEAD/DEAH box helicase n=1 Tax=Leptospira sp. GIMC2001 TaxID=1513297 RepID=UPI0023492971|nr:DEAD/DEAH box helicase [Leptospira sp. GIMC2001]WCL50590.1 DEAD/DEAH box helicase [Leptospira sp. GIMC2001]